jgi:hypothetical protein
MICGMRCSFLAVPRLVAPILLVIVACGGDAPTATRDGNFMTHGRLDLVTFDAKPLPDTLRVIGGNSSTPGGGSVTCPEILVGATLDLADDGTITRTSHLVYPCTGTLPRPSDLPDSLTRVEAGHATYGSTITITFDAGSPLTVLPSAEYARTAAPDLVVDRVASGQGLGSVESLANARVYRHE